MRTLLRISLFLMGIVLIGMAIGGEILRREPSTAYWVAGEFTDGDDHSIYLSSPNGGVQRRVVGGKLTNRARILEWLPDGRSFLYSQESLDGRQELHRYSFDTHQSTLLSPHFTNYSNLIPKVGAIPNRDEYTIILTPDQAAIFAINAHGDIIRQLSSFHDRIVRLPYWSSDGEWLYYVASDRDDTADSNYDMPQTLYRQRYDGSDHTRLISVSGYLGLLLKPSTPTTLFVTLYSNIGQGDIEESLPLYRVSLSTGQLTRITPDNGMFTLNVTDTGRWYIVYRRAANADIIGVFRLSPDGTELTSIFGDSTPHVNTLRYRSFIPVAPNYLVFTESSSPAASRYRLNIDTGEQITLLPENIIEYIAGSTLSYNGTKQIFYGQTADGSGIYRFDLVTGDLTPLMLDQLASSPNDDTWYTHWLLGVYQSYALVTREQLVSSEFPRSLYSLNIDTGDYSQLLPDIDFAEYAGVITNPLNENELYMLLTYDGGVTNKTLRINFETGDVEWVSLGDNLKFSYVFDRGWSLAITVGFGMGLLIFSSLWSMLKYRNYRSHNAINIAN